MSIGFYSGFYILGDIFLQNYYSVYNMETNTVGLALSISAASTAAITEGVDTGLTGAAKFGIVVLVFAIVIGLAILGCVLYKRRKLKKQLQTY